MRWKIVLQTVISTHSHWKLRVVAPVARQPTSEGESKTIVAGPDSSQAGHHQPEANSLAVVWWSSHPVNCRRIYHQEQLSSMASNIFLRAPSVSEPWQWNLLTCSVSSQQPGRWDTLQWVLLPAVRVRLDLGCYEVRVFKKNKKFFYCVLLILHLLLPVCPRVVDRTLISSADSSSSVHSDPTGRLLVIFWKRERKDS